jgi:hypothetical protein
MITLRSGALEMRSCPTEGRVDSQVAYRAGMNKRWMIVAAILVAAFFIQMPLILNSDLGWLLTLNEKILEGRKFGVDIFESNPPLSTYMYMPAVVIGRMAHVAPEFAVIAMVLVEIAGALLVVDRAMAAIGSAEGERDAAIWTLAFLLALLPGLVFGQREHIAVVALTPFVAITALRWRGFDPGPVAILAGLGAGLALDIRPFLGLVVGLPIILDAVRKRSLKPLFVPETWAIAAVAFCYAAVIVLVFSEYLFKYAPVVNEAYLPIRKGWEALVVIPIVILGASIFLLRLVGRQNVEIWSDATPWLAASVGGAAAYVVQGKGWPYTAFALCAFAMAAPLLSLRATTLRAPVMIASAAIVSLTGLYLSLQPPDFPPLAQHVEAIASHPRLLTITDHIALGHPLVRQLGGSWAGSSCAQLIAGGAVWQEKYSHPTQIERAKLDAIIGSEQRQLLADIRNGRPDVILVDTSLLSSFPFDWMAWANSDPGIRDELENYREVEDVGRVRILARTLH